MNQLPVGVIQADLSDPDHQRAILHLLDAYSNDPMGDGQPLSAKARRDVIPGLREHPTTMIFVAYLEAEPVGLAICFRGFSTFAARPLINIHDYFVLPAHRGSGIGRSLMGTIEQCARALGCCRLTLEVQENNHRARAIYAAAGFSPMVYVAEAGGSLNLAKFL